MPKLHDIYRQSLALLTDLYQLTMAQGYWSEGFGDHEAAFHICFRKHPFKGGFTVACGLATAIDFINAFEFADEDIEYLARLKGNDDKPLFRPEFLDVLRQVDLRCEIDAVPEGTVVFPYEPLVRVRGPVMAAQLLETPLLNIINFQTLIATKAARICLAAGDGSVLEFGLRRAQGIDGAITASRAAYIGGCDATSNVLAGKLFDIPVKGTHAHSWVMCFETEIESFKAWARALPNNCVFLVDTYDTLEGVRGAIEAGRWLRDNGHEMIGIRLDSGDLAWLSIQARRMLDEAGFPDASIVASNDLDENLIASLKQQGAPIGIWGVGTKLATAYDEPALGGVYKLAAIRSPDGPWQPRIKLSEQAPKTSTPGIQQVRRYRKDREFVADAIFEEGKPPANGCVIVDPLDPTRRKHVPADADGEDLLQPVFRQGRQVAPVVSPRESREHCREQMSRFHDGIKRFVNPHQYPAGLEQGLYELKHRLILETRGER